ncbi:hypothetical protein [Sulfodiicoccus acidiphilus]|nr:hypothetical protein [Sulfodiicoccus acidiphilus]
MEIDVEDLKRFLESKIASLKKEVEVYEYLLSVIEAGGVQGLRSSKGTVEYIKSSKGEVLAEVFYTPPLVRVTIKRKLQIPQAYFNALHRLLESEKNLSKVEYEVSTEGDSLREVVLKNINDDLTYSKLKSGIAAILEMLPR